MFDFLNIKDVNEMSIDELVGQVIMVGLPFDYLDDESKEFINKYKIGNYILFARNYKDTIRMKKFMNDLYRFTFISVDSFPLVSIDQEGGMVTRLFKDVTFPASPMTTAFSKTKDAIFSCGRIIGEDMMKLGLNLNLAPCLEINYQLSSHLVNVRSYGYDKETVKRNARRFIDGLHESNVLSCLKHFPGSGKSPKDSHLYLPVITESIDEVKNSDMYPFLKLLDSDAIMSSHCLFKAFDDVPTTLSKKFLSTFLREEMNYTGLIISDGMEMNAINDFYGIEKGSIMALNAGCDILLVCHDRSLQIKALEAVKQSIISGEINIEEIKKKVERINEAKKKVLIGLKKYFNNNPYEVNKQNEKLMEEIVSNSFMRIKGEAPIYSDDALIYSPKAILSSAVEDEFDNRNLTKELKKNFNNEIFEFNDEDDFVIKQLEYIEKQKIKNIICYSYDAYINKNQYLLINELNKLDISLYVVSLKGPMDLKYFNNIKNYCCLFEYTPNSIKCIIKQLKGKLQINESLTSYFESQL